MFPGGIHHASHHVSGGHVCPVAMCPGLTAIGFPVAMCPGGYVKPGGHVSRLSCVPLAMLTIKASTLYPVAILTLYPGGYSPPCIRSRCSGGLSHPVAGGHVSRWPCFPFVMRPTMFKSVDIPGSIHHV